MPVRWGLRRRRGPGGEGEMGGEKGVLVVEGTGLEGKIREGEPAASRRGWQA